MLPYFLTKLQLTTDADENSIKKAYAKALKKIDQEVEPEAFQDLRSAYESALAWLAVRPKKIDFTQNNKAVYSEKIAPQVVYHLKQEEKESSPVILETNTPRTNPLQIARQILHELLENLSGSESEESEAQEILRHSLADSRMIELEVKNQFEQLLAHHLSLGWQKGNGNLFGAAVVAFNWMRDRQRLRHFGREGVLLNQAAIELTLFNRQQEEYAKRQLELIRQLRKDERPSDSTLIYGMATLERMSEAFPNWLSLITNVRNIERWKVWDTEIPRKHRIIPAAKISSAQSDAFENYSSKHKFIYIFIVLALSFLAGIFVFRSDNSSQPPATRAYQQNRESQATRSLETKAWKNPTTLFYPKGGFRPVEQRPKPEKLSRIEISRIATGPTNAENCNETLRLAYIYKLGSMLQVQDFGADFDKHINSCVDAGLWVLGTYTDAAVRQANMRGKRRNFASYPSNDQWMEHKTTANSKNSTSHRQRAEINTEQAKNSNQLNTPQ